MSATSPASISNVTRQGGYDVLMADILSIFQELFWLVWSYPVPWVWIGWGMVTLVGLFGAVGVVIGLKMKRQDRKNANGP